MVRFIAGCCAALSTLPTLFAQPVTFNRQIAPIIYNNCSSCHRPGEAAPFALLSYQDVLRKGQIIAAATSSRLMPPWKADPASYAYRDERRLKDSDIALIQQWVKAGMPEGDGPAPASPKFASGWQLGEPDLVVEMPAGYHVPADGPDIYRNIAIPLGLTEDKWITAIDMKPSARAVVHHVLYFGDPTGNAHDRPQEGEQPGFSGMRAGGGATVPLGGWAIGAQPHFYPEGLALNVPKGTDLIIQYHFHPTGKPETEKSVVGFYFAKQAPERKLTAIQLPPTYSLFAGLAIAPGEKDYAVRDSYVLPMDLDAVGVGAHAHYLGKKLKLTATLPNGEVKTLLQISDWDFAWQDRYFFKDFVALPKGTRLDGEVHWDNSASNPHNPSSPPIAITWGEQSKDEMGSVSLIAVPHAASDYAALQADIRARTTQAARRRIQQDPSFAAKLRELMGR
jgi:mono/diheme cytochrome c family protein